MVIIISGRDVGVARIVLAVVDMAGMCWNTVLLWGLAWGELIA